MSPFWILLELKMMQAVVTTGAISSNKPTPNFLQARRPSCRLTTNVGALEGNWAIRMTGKKSRLKVLLWKPLRTWPFIENQKRESLCWNDPLFSSCSTSQGQVHRTFFRENFACLAQTDKESLDGLRKSWSVSQKPLGIVDSVVVLGTCT